MILQCVASKLRLPVATHQNPALWRVLPVPCWGVRITLGDSRLLAPFVSGEECLALAVTAGSSSDFPIQQGVGGVLEPWECQSPRTWLRRHMLGAHTKTVQTSEQPCPPSLHVLCGFQACVFDIQGQAWVVSRAGLLPISQMGCLRLAWVVQQRSCGFLTLC